MKVRKILVSQPKPSSDKSPYFDLAEKNNLKIDFRPFIHVEGVPSKEFKQQRIDILKHTAVIFTSRTAVDHFFRVAKELKVTVADEMKYFCISESIAVYLQKYIVYRKRKIFVANNKFDELVELATKHKDEQFLVPLSDKHKAEIPQKLEKKKIKFTKAILYRTVSSDLSDLAEVNYDILVFYSPTGIKSLFENFPEFVQDTTRIATFGTTTAKAVVDAGLKVNIKAPMPESPSMTMAIENYIKKENSKKKSN